MPACPWLEMRPLTWTTPHTARSTVVSPQREQARIRPEPPMARPNLLRSCHKCMSPTSCSHTPSAPSGGQNLNSGRTGVPGKANPLNGGAPVFSAASAHASRPPSTPLQDFLGERGQQFRARFFDVGTTSRRYRYVPRTEPSDVVCEKYVSSASPRSLFRSHDSESLRRHF